MKKVILAALFAGFVVGATAEEAKTFSVSAGPFIGVTAGGDIEESDLAYGGQVQVSIAEVYLVELAVSTFSDSYDGDNIETDQDTTSIGFSVGARAAVASKCGVYGLFGPNYNTSEADIDVDQDKAPGASAKIDFDDSVGFHAAVGATYEVSSRVSFFVEYRYTFLDLDAEASLVRTDGSTDQDDGDFSYDFGIAKAGLNVTF